MKRIAGDIFRDMRSEISGRFESMGARIDEAAAERQAMREVIDSLASQDDFDALDRKIFSVSADTQATGQAMHDMKAAGIPVRSCPFRAQPPWCADPNADCICPFAQGYQARTVIDLAALIIRFSAFMPMATSVTWPRHRAPRLSPMIYLYRPNVASTKDR